MPRVVLKKLNAKKGNRKTGTIKVGKIMLLMAMLFVGLVIVGMHVQYKMVLNKALSLSSTLSEPGKIAVSVPQAAPQQQQEQSSKLSSTSQSVPQIHNNHAAANKHPRFVTVLMPSVVNEKGVGKRLKAIHETWGPAANVIFVVSVKSLPLVQDDYPEVASLPVVPADSSTAVSYPQVLWLPEHLSENDMPRLQYVISNIFQLVHPEFAFFANDHTFVIPEHLCAFLQGRDPLHFLYAGHALQTNQYVFNSGAAGYFLSWSTMRRMTEVWSPHHHHTPHCAVVSPETNMAALSQHERFMQQSPGLFLSDCLLEGLDVHAMDTRYGLQHRFHAFGLVAVVSGKWDAWYAQKHTQEAAHVIDADPSYATVPIGEDCCAPTTATFHYVEDLECRALYKVRQLLLSQDIVSDEELQRTMISVWPKNPNELGRSKPLPDADNKEDWEPLLETIRKISKKDTGVTC